MIDKEISLGITRCNEVINWNRGFQPLSHYIFCPDTIFLHNVKESVIYLISYNMYNVFS